MPTPGMLIRLVALVIALAFLAAPLAAEAQPGKVYRIGILTTVAAGQVSGPTPSNPHVRALVQRLGELGWIYGRNLVTEPRGAEGKLDRLPSLAEALVRAGVDVIVTSGGNPAALAAQRATSTIAIVMLTSGDPVGAGLVSSLARPGGNITGMSLDAGPEIYGKRLALLREAAPHITRLGVISRQGGQRQPWHKVLTTAAGNVRMALVHAPVGETSDYATAFATLTRERVDALLASDTSLNWHNQRLIIDFAAGQRLPTIYAFRASVEAGGLLAYRVDVLAIYRRAAEYVDRVLRGTRPADLPVEQPTNSSWPLTSRPPRSSVSRSRRPCCSGRITSSSSSQHSGRTAGLGRCSGGTQSRHPRTSNRSDP